MLILMMGWFLTAAAMAQEPSPQEVRSGTLLLRMQAGLVTATRTNTEVSMNISGLVARVSVRQEFENGSDEWTEGVYVFPLPDRAAVDRMRLFIGERFIEGEIREKEQARKDYEQARSEGRKASLVEQERPNLFTTSVANIAPGERVVVEIEYLEDVRYDNGTFAIRFPMTLTPRYIPGSPLPDRTGSGWSPDTTRVNDASRITPPHVTASTDHRVSLRAHIDAGMPLEIVASRYHPVQVSEDRGRYTVVLANDAVPLDHDFELSWRPVPSAVPRAMLFRETIEGQPHYLLMVMPPDAAQGEPPPMPRELILVVDTSGSMHGASIAQAKQALARALDGLAAGDRFNIVEFNSSTRALYHQSVAADAANIAHARKFVQRLEANGGTEMRPALQLALDAAGSEAWLRQIVFITDGSVGNEEELYTMIESRLGNARLFTVGIGSAPNSWFMRKAAEAGRGSFVVISALHEVGEQMDRLFDKLARPQVTDIRVSWPGGAVTESYPETVPDLYSGEPVTVRARASGPFQPGSGVRVSGDSAGGAWTRELALDGRGEHPGIGALWARAKIAALHDEERRGGNAEALRKAVVDTAVGHHLVSKYTSLIAVDKTPVRPAGAALAREQVPNLLPYGQDKNAIFGFPATATGAGVLRRRGLLTLLAGLLLLAVAALRRGNGHARPA
ncbi:MAG TPA: marine proteobacterial sortase target protein [Woeseiaceae bacterium]|nr:marine proteobacterial sortase target protein [Woeseiaceae bacterium]